MTATPAQLVERVAFLELMYNILHKGGRCAVIVPEGALTGNTNAHKDVKKMLVENCQIDAIISMPPGVFKPYSGVVTSVVIFTKGGKTKSVWFYGMTADGFSLDDKRTPTPDKNDIPDIIKKWKNNREIDNTKSWSAHYDQIKDEDYNLSANQYKPRTLSHVRYEEPSLLLEQILKLENGIIDDIKLLQSMIQPKE